MRLVYVGFLILAVVFGLFIGYFLWVPTWQIPHNLRYDILKDTLTIVLAVLALGIAVIGYAVYQMVTGRLKAESEASSRLQMNVGSARLFTRMGYAFWEEYFKGKKEKKKQPQYLDLAISVTEQGLKYYSTLREEEKKKRENEVVLCMIKNNLAYYLSERNWREDGDLARDYAEHIYKKLQEFPEHKDAWLDTYNFVKKQYPNQISGMGGTPGAK